MIILSGDLDECAAGNACQIIGRKKYFFMPCVVMQNNMLFLCLV